MQSVNYTTQPITQDSVQEPEIMAPTLGTNARHSLKYRGVAYQKSMVTSQVSPRTHRLTYRGVAYSTTMTTTIQIQRHLSYRGISYRTAA